MASAEKMDMQMRDGFASVGSVVDHYPKAIVKIHGLCGFSSDEKKVPHESSIFFSGFTDARDRFSRDHKKMNGGLWINVAENDAKIVLVHEISRNFTIDDFAEQGFIGHGGIKQRAA